MDGADDDEEEEEDVFIEEEEEFRFAQRVIAFSTTAAKVPILPGVEYADDEDKERADGEDSRRIGCCVTGGWSSGSPL